MIKNSSVFIASLLCLAVFASCSQVGNDSTVTSDVGEVTWNPSDISDENTSDDYRTTDNTSNNTIDTIDRSTSVETIKEKPEIEPPLSEEDLTMAVPDFLDEEQQLLYRRARSIFRAFTGYPFQIDEYPPDRDTGAYTAVLGEVIGISDGEYTRYYYAATGRYKKWDDFISMGTSIFTSDYFNELSNLFLNIDGYTYIPDVAMGGRRGYLPELSPDTFNLISMTDTEICFEVVGHYFDTCNVTTADPNSVTTESFPLTMVLIEDGWRFSLFNSPAS